MPPHICKLTVYLNRTVYSFRMFKGSGRAGKNLAGGSLKYLFTCFKNRIFKKRYRKLLPLKGTKDCPSRAVLPRSSWADALPRCDRPRPVDLPAADVAPAHRVLVSCASWWSVVPSPPVGHIQHLLVFLRVQQKRGLWVCHGIH